jgi:hypothetical protein
MLCQLSYCRIIYIKIKTKIETFLSMAYRGAFKIVAGWWGHQPRETAVGVLTDHGYEGMATIRNALLTGALLTNKCLRGPVGGM